ncbi:MAG: isochorismatase family protein [Geminicoccaceae bacterium]|nr:isochorismatase family protein [Geminicoccaceae bacterium]
MAHEARSPAFRELIDLSEPVEQLATGFDFTEGPVWHPIEGCLLFSDMPADVRRRWSPEGGVVEVARPSNKSNGLTFDAELNLLVCEHATSSLVRIRRDGRREVLASHFEGKELNSPNDVCVRSDGSIYFTDPFYGRMPVYGVERPRELGFQGVYRVVPGEPPRLLVERYLFDQPNGLCFSPDERRLYVNDTVQALIRVFEVRSDGTLSPGRIFASGIRSELEPGVPDGMKCDERGNLWCTGPGGVWVFDPEGRHIGVLRVPELTANLAWGGPDWHTLFLTASRSLYAVRTKVGPRLEPFMRAAARTKASARTPSATSGRAPARAIRTENGFRLDPARCALLIQDMQNDVVMEGGAFAASGAPQHCREQNAIANIVRLADHCRKIGVPVIHVWFVVEPGAPGLTLNCPLFEGVVEARGLVRGTWGAAPVPGLEPRPGDFVVEKMRMSAWEGTKLETILKALGRDILIDTGAWTNMSIEHTARTGAESATRSRRARSTARSSSARCTRSALQPRPSTTLTWSTP